MQQVSTDARALTNLIDAAISGDTTWSEEDFGPILQHQLDTPLAVDLSHIFPNIHQVLGADKSQTFRDLLSHSYPSIARLTLAKAFAKRLHRMDGEVYPKDVAMVLYYASIAAATRVNARITSLSRAEIRKGFMWSLGRTWLTQPLSSLFIEALDIVNQEIANNA